MSAVPAILSTVFLLASIILSITAYFLKWNEFSIFLLSTFSLISLNLLITPVLLRVRYLFASSNFDVFIYPFILNIATLSITFFSLKAGLLEVVKATIAGNFIKNLLVGIGLTAFLGGIKFKEQDFQPVIARMNATITIWALGSIFIPTYFHFLGNYSNDEMLLISRYISIIAIIFYGFKNIFFTTTHAYLRDVGTAFEEGQDEESPHIEFYSIHSIFFWAGILFLIVVLITFESDLFVGTLQDFGERLGLNEVFLGIIVLPVVGSAVDIAESVKQGLKNRMDESIYNNTQGSLDTLIFIAPVLVFMGWFVGQPMDLNLGLLQAMAMLIAVVMTNSVISDGLLNWLEGWALLSTYLLLGAMFYFNTA